MTEEFFPFTVRGNSYNSDRCSGGVYHFQKAFQTHRPKTIMTKETWGTFVHERTEDFSYYCYDVIILSKSQVEFVCFDMEDNVYGGRGKEIHRFKVDGLESLTPKYIENRLMARARARRDEELQLHEFAICVGYAGEEKIALGL